MAVGTRRLTVRSVASLTVRTLMIVVPPLRPTERKGWQSQESAAHGYLNAKMPRWSTSLMEPLKEKWFADLGVDAHETHPDLAILRGVGGVGVCHMGRQPKLISQF
jgi:hypothetical protein